MPKLIDLFLTFLRIGTFTFGGGYVMIPLIQKAVSDDKGWITHDEILEIVAIAESTPGPLAINTATFVGYRIGGVVGAFLATLAVVMPSFVIIVLISTVLSAFAD
ncbi:MAG: chromate transporter, partial [Spirochaetales bacterium]|nr:chromate transporter [Spirochaetales bacterium]